MRPCLGQDKAIFMACSSSFQFAIFEAAKLLGPFKSNHFFILFF